MSALIANYLRSVPPGHTQLPVFNYISKFLEIKAIATLMRIQRPIYIHFAQYFRPAAYSLYPFPGTFCLNGMYQSSAEYLRKVFRLRPQGREFLFFERREGKRPRLLYVSPFPIPPNMLPFIISTKLGYTSMQNMYNQTP